MRTPGKTILTNAGSKSNLWFKRQNMLHMPHWTVTKHDTLLFTNSKLIFTATAGYEFKLLPLSHTKLEYLGIYVHVSSNYWLKHSTKPMLVILVHIWAMMLWPAESNIIFLMVFQLLPVQQPKPSITPRWIIPTNAVSVWSLYLRFCSFLIHATLHVNISHFVVLKLVM